jgi:hypothetical protein
MATTTEKSYLDQVTDYVTTKTKKDADNLESQYKSFHQQADGSWTNLTDGSTATPGVTNSLNKNKQLVAGQKKASLDINPGSVEPLTYSNTPLYTEKANSESYKTESPGKANGGAGTDSNATTVPGEKDVFFSRFNKWSLFNYIGSPFNSRTNDAYNKPSSATNGESGNRINNPSTTNIIETLKDKQNPAYQYDYSDFALAKYHGKISNNYLVTVRRFPVPIEDNIINPNVIGANGTVITKGMPDIAAVTWMSEKGGGNKLEDILKFDVALAWKKIESSVQEISSSGGKGGKVGSMIGSSGLASAIYGAANGMNASQVKSAKEGYDNTKGTYPNHVFGPINIVKEVMMRDAGLQFNQGFELKFNYSLRQLEGVSPKAAFLDMFANLLTLTYNNGNFWGGSSRYTGGSSKFNKPFGNQAMLKSGDFGGFFGSLLGGAMKGIGNIAKDISINGLLGSAMGKNIIGGGLMDMFGSPQGGEAVNAFLTGDATGQYHVTVGNPLNPIAVVGNLYCDKTDFKFSGPLSYEGFPTELEMTMSLKPARPRDKADIEKMFNGGAQRMYLTPVAGVDTNLTQDNTGYGNADTPVKTDIYRKMTNG